MGRYCLFLFTVLWSGFGFCLTKAILIPQPFAQVSQVVRNTIFQASGPDHFIWKDESQPLMNLEREWLLGAFYYNPSIYPMLHGELSVEQKSLLTQGVIAGVLTQKEYDRYANYLSESNKYIPGNLQQVPFLTQNIKKYTFERKKGDIYQYGFVMDASMLLNKENMTLFFYSAQSEETASKFDFFTCMTGVVCVFNPHVTTTTMPPEPYIDRKLTEKVASYLKENHALSEKETDAYMHVFYENLQQQTIDAGLLVGAEHLSETPLIDYDVPNETVTHSQTSMSAVQTLPDGRLLIIIDSETHLYKISHNKLQETNVPFQLASAQVDSKGNLWGFSYNESGVDLVKWSPATQKNMTIHYDPFNTLAPNSWLVTEKGQLFLMRDGEILTLPVHGNEFVSTNVYWNWQLRFDINESLDNTDAPHFPSSEIKFNDNLFWLKDRDVYGISPQTGKVDAVISTTQDIFFGSRQANWAIAAGGFDEKGQYYVYNVDLASGKALMGIRTGITIPDKNSHPCLKLARTAQGRLLAVAGERDVAIWDMKAMQPVARLAIAKGYKVVAAAFTWSGDKLWLYMISEDNRLPDKLAQWDVPANFRDRAAAAALPDQNICHVEY